MTQSIFNLVPTQSLSEVMLRFVVWSIGGEGGREGGEGERGATNLIQAVFNVVSTQSLREVALCFVVGDGRRAEGKGVIRKGSPSVSGDDLVDFEWYR